jgi:hypothetical protein
MPRDTPHPQLHATTPGKLAWLVLFALLWAFYGLAGRDAWQADEALALGAVLDWLEGGRLPPQAPLYTWVAGLTARLLEGVYELQVGARWASGLFALIGVLFTGLAARSLYGPGYGAMAALLLMGAFGLVLRVHALLPETALLAGYALVLYGLAESRRGPDRAWAVLAGAIVLLLTRGLVDLLAVLLCATLPLALPGFATRSYRLALLKAGVLLALAVIAWLAYLGSGGLLADWWAGQLARLTAYRGVARQFNTLLWFAWPAWPLALAAIWHEYRRLGRENPLHLPLFATGAALLAGLFPAYSHDGVAMPALVPLTLLATFGIATLRRGAAQAFYWFGVTCFAFFTLAFWLYYGALEWGVPERLASHLARMTPGYTPQVGHADVLLAAAATLVWLMAVPLFPRAQVRPALVWATGITLSWVLLMALLRPWAELSWGYRPVVDAMAARLPEGACVAIEATGAARIMMDYHLANRRPRPGEVCGWRLVVEGREAEARSGVELVWEGHRPRHKREVYRLYRSQGDDRLNGHGDGHPEA